MSFVTRGTIKVVFTPAAAEVKVSPTNEYRVTHDRVTYTVFVNPPTPESKCFPDSKLFKLSKSYGSLPLAEIAIKGICVEITINGADNITAIQVPA